jgi:hypothetical protein
VSGPKPKASKLLRYNPEGIPQVLREHPHWLVCGWDGKPVAMPGVGNSKTNSEDWVDFATASRIAESKPELWPYLVLTDETAFTVFDVDFKPRIRTLDKIESEDEYCERLARADRAQDHLRKLFPIRYESRSKSNAFR